MHNQLFRKIVFGSLRAPFFILSCGLPRGASQGELGRRGRKTRLFAKQKCRALLVYKQSYGCFEMVLFPAKTGDLKVYLHSKNFKLHPFALYDGKIRYLIPPAALNLERFASSARKRNGTVEIFSFSEQPQNSVRTSLVPLSICLRKIFQ